MYLVCILGMVSRVVHITTFSKNSLGTLGIIEDRSKKFADFFW